MRLNGSISYIRNIVKNLTRIEAAYIIANKVYAEIEFYLQLDVQTFTAKITNEIDVIRYGDRFLYMRYLVNDSWIFETKSQLINKIKHSDNINAYLKSVSTG